MKTILTCCIVMVFFHLKTAAQVYQFTSDREGVAKGHSTNIEYEKKDISVTIDITHKKITLDRGQPIAFTIVSTDTTLTDKDGGEILKYHCTDSQNSKHILVFIIYSDALQAVMGVAGTLAVALDSKTYGYELRKK